MAINGLTTISMSLNLYKFRNNQYSIHLAISMHARKIRITVDDFEKNFFLKIHYMILFIYFEVI